jgi:hypothetical protein
MKFRRRQRWLRRFAFAFAFAAAVAAGKVSPAWAKFDDGGTSGRTIVVAGGWSGAVDSRSGIPLSAGIPHGDEQFLSTATAVPSGDEIAIRNAMADRKLAAAEGVHDPYLTDIYVRQGESLGGPDGIEELMSTGELTVIPYLSHGILGEAVKSRPAVEAFIPGVTDFPRPESVATRPDDLATRFTVPANPPVISYLSHGMGADGEVGARPDNRADRFTPADGVSPTQVEVAGDSRDWDGLLTVGFGAVVLGLALGLAFGYLRRPRLAL